eukprot:1986720-Amphidinium_carterae.1
MPCSPTAVRAGTCSLNARAIHAHQTGIGQRNLSTNGLSECKDYLAIPSATVEVVAVAGETTEKCPLTKHMLSPQSRAWDSTAQTFHAERFHGFAPRPMHNRDPGVPSQNLHVAQVSLNSCKESLLQLSKGSLLQGQA